MHRGVKLACPLGLWGLAEGRVLWELIRNAAAPAPRSAPGAPLPVGGHAFLWESFCPLRRFPCAHMSGDLSERKRAKAGLPAPGVLAYRAGPAAGPGSWLETGLVLPAGCPGLSPGLSPSLVHFAPAAATCTHPSAGPAAPSAAPPPGPGYPAGF